MGGDAARVVGSLGLTLPVGLWVLDGLRDPAVAQPRPSLSAYYYAEDRWVRRYFVGDLLLTGAALVVFRVSRRPWSNRLSTLAGAAVWVVALVPCGVTETGQVALLPGQALSAQQGASRWHFGAAATFFGAAWLLTTRYAREEADEEARSLDRSCRVVMTLGALVVASALVGPGARSPGTRVFLGESLGLAGFAASWLVKGRIRAALQQLRSGPPEVRPG